MTKVASLTLIILLAAIAGWFIGQNFPKKPVPEISLEAEITLRNYINGAIPDEAGHVAPESRQKSYLTKEFQEKLDQWDAPVSPSLCAQDFPGSWSVKFLNSTQDVASYKDYSETALVLYSGLYEVSREHWVIYSLKKFDDQWKISGNSCVGLDL